MEFMMALMMAVVLGLSVVGGDTHHGKLAIEATDGPEEVCKEKKASIKIKERGE